MSFYLIALLFLHPGYSDETTKTVDKYEKAKQKLVKIWKEQEEKSKRKPASDKTESSKLNVEDYLLGASPSASNDFKKSLPKEDKKRNVLEVVAAPGLLYFDTDTDYFYRKMRSYSPSLELGANIWFSPYTGFQANYLSSLGASVRDDLDGQDSSIISHEWFRFGIQKRILLQGQSDHLTFSLNYRSYQLKAPVDSPTRGNLEQSFYGVGLSYLQKKSPSREKEIGFRLYFFGNEEEEGGDVDYSSGSLEKSYSLSIYTKQSYVLSRKHSFFAKLRYQLDKQIYRGAVDPADPKSGEVIEGVDIKSTYLLFQLGYEWGGG